jgi:hypothetical protein
MGSRGVPESFGVLRLVFDTAAAPDAFMEDVDSMAICGTENA